MDYIPCSWGLRLENFVYGSTEEYDYEERTLEMGVRTPAEGEQMSHKIKY